MEITALANTFQFTSQRLRLGWPEQSPYAKAGQLIQQGWLPCPEGFEMIWYSKYETALNACHYNSGIFFWPTGPQCHLSHDMCQISFVMCHMSHVTIRKKVSWKCHLLSHCLSSCLLMKILPYRGDHWNARGEQTEAPIPKESPKAWLLLFGLWVNLVCIVVLW